MPRSQPLQPSLFDAPRTRLDARFAAFHEANPHVYTLLVRLARRAKRRGLRRCSVKTLFEVARWLLQLRTKGDPFRLNNSFTSRYARLIEQREPDLRGFFETRSLRS